jgi:hypothetical protein
MGGATQTVLTVVAVAAVIIGAEPVGLAIFESLGAEAAAAAAEAGITASEVGSAAVGAGSSAINSAVAGGNVEDVLKAAAIGGASSFVAAEIGGEIGGGFEAPGQAGPTAAELGYVPPPSQIIEPTGVAGATDSVTAGNIARGGSAGFTRGFTQAELSGQNLQTALKRGEIGGLTGLVTSGISELLQSGGATPKEAGVATAVGGPYLSKEIAGYFPSSTSASQVSSKKSSSPTGGLPTSGTAYLGGGGAGGGRYFTPGSSALGQALNVGGTAGATGGGSTGGYNATGESLSKETGGTPQNVWNIESLRVKPEES